MQSAKKAAKLASLNQELVQFSANQRPLPGINNAVARDVLTRQILDSIRRVEYVYSIAGSQPSHRRSDPHCPQFDPLRAAVLNKNSGNLEEACWLVFLAIHFGKSVRSGWLLTSDIYGKLGATPYWSWAHVSANPQAFTTWMPDCFATIRANNLKRTFGNHRKYETLDPTKNSGLNSVIESYVNWVAGYGSHQLMLAHALQVGRKTPREAFSYLYSDMKVNRFGRTAKFDYLTMIAKLGLANIEPGSCYLNQATGPLTGARLLFQGSSAPNFTKPTLEACLIQLESALTLGHMGMQVMEDSICNWQKSPRIYQLFKG